MEVPQHAHQHMIVFMTSLNKDVITKPNIYVFVTYTPTWLASSLVGARTRHLGALPLRGFSWRSS